MSYKYVKTSERVIYYLSEVLKNGPKEELDHVYESLDTNYQNSKGQLSWDYTYGALEKMANLDKYDSLIPIRIKRGGLWTLCSIIDVVSKEIFFFMKDERCKQAVLEPNNYLFQSLCLNACYNEEENSKINLIDFDDAFNNQAVQEMFSEVENIEDYRVFVLVLENKSKVVKINTYNGNRDLVSSEFVTKPTDTEFKETLTPKPTMNNPTVDTSLELKIKQEKGKENGNI